MKPPLHVGPFGDIFDRLNDCVVHDTTETDHAYIIAAVNAVHRLGLTAEQLNDGALDKLVEAVECYLQGVGDKYGLQVALAPFTGRKGVE